LFAGDEKVLFLFVFLSVALLNGGVCGGRAVGEMWGFSPFRAIRSTDTAEQYTVGLLFPAKFGLVGEENG